MPQSSLFLFFVIMFDNLLHSLSEGADVAVTMIKPYFFARVKKGSGEYQNI